MTWQPPKALSVFAVEADRWDRRELTDRSKDVKEFGRARRRMGKALSTGTNALDDAFMLLVKADPRLLPTGAVEPSHLVNRAVADELAGLSVLRRLRDLSVGDAVQSAFACVTLAPTLQTIFDRLKVEQAMAAELAALRDQLLGALKDLSDARDDFDGQFDEDDVDGALAAAEDLRRLQEIVSALEAQRDEQTEALMDRLEGEGGMVRSSLRDSLLRAADEAEGTVSEGRAWGLGTGDLKRLSAHERLAWAKRLNDRRMQAISQLFGRLRSLSLAVSSTVADRREETVDLEFGDDLARVVPSELLGLMQDETEMDFLARWGDRRLLQYSVEGTDELGRGGIVVAIDGSGSMEGDREIWAKGLMLVLLHHARAQRRTIHVINFGGPGDYVTHSFTSPADFSADRIVQAAEAWWGVGTHFQTPMEVGLEILGNEFRATGSTESDVVFITDDACWVDPEFMAHYLSEMKRMGSRTWGLAVRADVAQGGALSQMSEGRVATIHDLRSATGAESVLRGVR